MSFDQRTWARTWTEPLALGVACFVLYALGASRTIYVGDSGELVAAVYTLGIPHPTGYPLYVLLGKLWTLLVPVGSIAFRMSLMSGACAAAAVAGLFALGRSLGLDRIAAYFAALLLAFAPSFWAEANVQRVYTLNAMLLVAALTTAARWHRDRSKAAFVLTALLAGLGATNHTFMGFFAVAFGISAVVREPKVLREWKLIGAAAVATLSGLLVYAYLPLRSRMDPALDWGNPESWSGFLDVVLRRGFWQRRFWEGPADILPIGGDYLRGIGIELFWIGVPFAIAGIVFARRRGWPLVLLVATAAANLTSMAMHGSRSDLFIWHRYYVPSYVVMALFAGLGAQVLADKLPRLARALPLALPVAMLIVGYPKYDRSRYRIADDFSRSLLATLPPGAHLMASDDNILFVLIYLSLVEGVRPDVDLVMQGAGGSGTPQLRFDPEGDPLFLTHHPNWTLPSLDIVPVGLVFRALRAGAPLPPPMIPETSLEGENDPRVPKDHLTRNLIGDFHYMLGITWEIRDWPRARDELELASSIAFDNDVLHYNLGLIYWRNGLFERSLQAFEHSAEINPRHLASNDRVYPMDKVRELRAEVSRVHRVEAALAQTPQMQAVGAADDGSPEWHLVMASMLEARGEDLAATGHRLRAYELGGAPTRTAFGVPEGGVSPASAQP